MFVNHIIKFKMIMGDKLNKDCDIKYYKSFLESMLDKLLQMFGILNNLFLEYCKMVFLILKLEMSCI